RVAGAGIRQASRRMSKVFAHPAALVNMVRRIAVEAGEITLDYFEESGFSEASLKDDGSPVTEADTKAEQFIINALKDISPDVKAVGEESCAQFFDTDLSQHDFFWLVDPLD